MRACVFINGELHKWSCFKCNGILIILIKKKYSHIVHVSTSFSNFLYKYLKKGGGGSEKLIFLGV